LSKELLVEKKENRDLLKEAGKEIQLSQTSYPQMEIPSKAVVNEPPVSEYVLETFSQCTENSSFDVEKFNRKLGLLIETFSENLELCSKLYIEKLEFLSEKINLLIKFQWF
jgi:hypothetical protein